MSYIFCNNCQEEFKVVQEEGYVSCPNCSQEFRVSGFEEVEYDSLKGDQQDNNFEGSDSDLSNT